MLRRVVLPVVLVALAAAACGGGEEPAAVEDTAPGGEEPGGGEGSARAGGVRAFGGVKGGGRVAELLSEGVDADGARAVIDAWVAEHQDGWEGQHTVQVIAEPDAGMVVCRAKWVEDEEASEVLTGGRVTSGDGTWPVVEVDCP